MAATYLRGNIAESFPHIAAVRTHLIPRRGENNGVALFRPRGRFVLVTLQSGGASSSTLVLLPSLLGMKETRYNPGIHCLFRHLFLNCAHREERNQLFLRELPSLSLWKFKLHTEAVSRRSDRVSSLNEVL